MLVKIEYIYVFRIQPHICNGGRKMNNNFNESQKLIGYTSRKQTSPEVYRELGLMSGLEVHQQLKTEKKLFCHCPAGVFQKDGEYDAEVIRHMRPTLSEMGGYDGTALMEFKTRKNIVYHIANITTCTYDIDDTPPFKINRQALEIAMEIALLLKTNIVGELHITRKQYLDGSIPTGFQRTGIISIEGKIPLTHKDVGIIQLSLEEDSCREVLDIGHKRIYTTDRLGIPLIEVVTYPDMKTPDEVFEAAEYIRFLNRSTGKVRTGIGAAREDVNVSITGGTRIEIKGVSHISNIPELVHNEVFRQKSLLEIRKILCSKIPDYKNWNMSYIMIDNAMIKPTSKFIQDALNKKYSFAAVNLPGFNGILSFFNEPGRSFEDEISDRLKVIACIEKPNMICSEDSCIECNDENFKYIRNILNSQDEDAQIIFWGSEDDIKTALETIEERCRMAFEGVPKETRKSLEDGTTMFERVLPGADRMYPDTDSAPISISEELIETICKRLPEGVNEDMEKLKKWDVPKDSYCYLLRYHLVPFIDKIIGEFKCEPKFVATLLSHRLKYLQTHAKSDSPFDIEKIYELFTFMRDNNLNDELMYEMLPVIYRHPKMDMNEVLCTIKFHKELRENIVSLIPALRNKFSEIKTSDREGAEFRWVMSELRKIAIGNMPMHELAEVLHKGGI